MCNYCPNKSGFLEEPQCSKENLVKYLELFSAKQIASSQRIIPKTEAELCRQGHTAQRQQETRSLGEGRLTGEAVDRPFCCHIPTLLDTLSTGQNPRVQGWNPMLVLICCSGFCSGAALKPSEGLWKPWGGMQRLPPGCKFTSGAAEACDIRHPAPRLPPPQLAVAVEIQGHDAQHAPSGHHLTEMEAPHQVTEKPKGSSGAHVRDLRKIRPVYLMLTVLNVYYDYIKQCLR